MRSAYAGFRRGGGPPFAANGVTRQRLLFMRFLNL